MAIPSRQIGWGTEENLLWQISKQLEYLTRVVYNIPNNTTTTTTTSTSSTTTTTTTTIDPNNLSLTVDNSTNFDIAENSPFTIEWFAYYANTGNHPRAYSFGSYLQGGASHAVSIENGTFYWWVGGSIIINAPVSIENGWHHFCIESAGFGAAVRAYVDGVQIGIAANPGAIPTNGLPLYIGSEGDDSLSNALFSNFRWNNTVAVYPTFGFTPPTEPLSAVTGTTLLLFQGNGLSQELTDNSIFNNVITNGSGSYNAGNPFVGEQGSIQFGTIPTLTVLVNVHPAPFCVSSPLTSFSVTGNGTTFCNSTQFTASEFASLPSGTLALRYGPVDILQVTTDGSDVAVVSLACYTC